MHKRSLKVAGIILAAGRGERMGAPKALMELDGMPAALRHAELFQSAGVEPIHIVLGCDHGEIRRRLSGWNSFVINRNWEAGQFSSLLAGLAEIESGSWCVVMPVDTGIVKSETLNMLMDSLDEEFDAVIPVYDGRKGHPVVLSPGLCVFLIEKQDETSRLDHILRSRKVLLVEVGDKAVISNINTPEDFVRLYGK